jgi:hypothetical protein
MQIDEPIEYRFMASMEISDHSARQWVSAFGDTVRRLILALFVRWFKRLSS